MNVDVALSKTVTGTPAEVKAATEVLTKAEKEKGFSVYLLRLIVQDGVDENTKLSASIYLKNFIGKYWPMGENQDFVIPEEDTAEIKKQIVNLMFSPNKLIQKQVADALAIISSAEFPEKWPEILPTLVQLTQQSIAQNNPNQVIYLLKATYAVLHRFRNADDDEQVNKELAYILPIITKPIEDQFNFCSGIIKQNPNKETTVIVFHILHQLLKIFYCLNFVTLPEVFEDKIQFWMSEHLFYLNFNSTDDALIGEDEKPGCLLKIKADICDNISIYAQKYEEEFEPFLPQFVQAVWEILTKVDPEDEKFSELVSKGITVLTCICKGASHKIVDNQEFFRNTTEKIIIPNMIFREADKLQFKEDHVEYIRSDLEGSNLLTRRNCACELVIGLRKHYENQVTAFCGGYVTNLLEQYKQDKKKNWKQKDVALYLFTALTVSGGTRLQGTTIVNALVPIKTFFEAEILPELKDTSTHPVILADALKFIITFRNQIEKAYYPEIFTLATTHIISKEYVVSTYAAALIERLLTVKDGTTVRFTSADLQPHLVAIFTNIFAALHRANFSNNDYLVKTIMRVLSVAGGLVAEMSESLFKEIIALLERIRKTPGTPVFNHYVFESLACVVKCVHAVNPASVTVFESALMPLFNLFLQQDDGNFSPYVFQLIAMFLELYPGTSLTPNHLQLLSFLVSPKCWEETGNIPALVRVFKAFLRKDIAGILAAEKLNPILGVFQKLLASPMQDHHAFEILRVIIDVLPFDVLKSVIGQIFTLIFSRLSSKPTAKFSTGFVVFCCRFTHKFNLSFLKDVSNNIKEGIFNRVLAVWATNLPKIGVHKDRTTAIIVTTNVLCDPLLQTETFASEWRALFIALATLFVDTKKVEVTEESDNFELTQNRALGVQTSFVKLVHSECVPEVDPFLQLSKSAGGLHQYAVQTLLKSSQANNAVWQSLVQPTKSDNFARELAAAISI